MARVAPSQAGSLLPLAHGKAVYQGEQQAPKATRFTYGIPTNERTHEVSYATEIKARYADPTLRYRSDDEMPAALEITLDAMGGAPEVGAVRKADDWTLSYADKKGASERQLGDATALVTTSGSLWWDAMTPAGFGPTEPSALGSGATWSVPDDHVLVELAPVDTDELREAASLPRAHEFASLNTVGGMYRDFMQAASVSTPELDDLFSESGYDWQSLDDAASVDAAERLQAWWA